MKFDFQIVFFQNQHFVVAKTDTPQKLSSLSFLYRSTHNIL